MSQYILKFYVASIFVLLSMQPCFAQVNGKGEMENSTGHGWHFSLPEALSGMLRTNYFYSSRMLDDEKDFIGASLQAKYSESYKNNLKVLIEARLTRADLSNHSSIDSQARLIEGYVSLNFSNVDLRLGKQIVAWGRADGVNPTDNITPRDFTLMLPFENDQRQGIVGLLVDTYLSNNFTFSAFISPMFEPSTVPIPPNYQIIDEQPADRLDESQVGFKLDNTGGTLDWSVSYFQGHSLLPNVRLQGVAPSGLILRTHYEEIKVVGADLARNYGRYGFRGEAAYFFTDDARGEDFSIKNPFFYYIVGVDRTFFDNLSVNLQLIGRWINNFQDPYTLSDQTARDIAVLNSLLGGQQYKTSYGLTSRIGKKWLYETLETELLVFVNFKRINSYIRPLATYVLSDHIKLTVGADIYRGAADTYFGSFKSNTGGFAELRYSF